MFEAKATGSFAWARFWLARAGWLLAWLGCAAGTAFAASFTVSMDRDSIVMGETATLTMSFEGGSIKGIPALPRMEGLSFSQALGHNTVMTSYNGQMRVTETITIEVTPTRTGTFTIPAMTTEVGGQTCESQPLKVTVSKSTEAAGATNLEQQIAFLRLAVKKDKIHVGEMVEAQVQLFLRNDVADLRNFQFEPIPAEGFTVGKNKEEQHTQMRVGNSIFTMIPFRMVFTAAKAGPLKLGPASCNMDLLFGPMDFFGRATSSRHVPLVSEEVPVEVQPLPEQNKPAGFNGAVGDYHLNINVGPTNIAVGDPVTVTIQISGRGALESLTLPEQTGWDKFKIYPPTSDFVAGDDLGLSGTRTFKLTIVPQGMDVQKVPPYVFSFYDPEANQYRTVSGPAVPLVVRPSAASLPPPGLMANANASDSPPTNSDILHIKPFLGEVEVPQAPLVARPWFLALQSLPALAWLTLLVRRKQGERLAANPRLKRQRQVEKAVREGLKKLRQAAGSGEPEAFFAALFRLLQERLGEKLDLPASAITEAVLDERLRPLGVDDGVIEQARELFRACDQARYARQNSSEELMSLVAKLETTMAELGRLKL